MRRNFLIALLFLTLSGGQAAADKRVALVIGNSGYQHAGRLANPVNDADAITATFRQAGFDVVESRRDLKVNDMRRALRDFSDMARDSDVAVIYYAGHGIEVDGNNYVLPVDALLERDADVYDEALALERLLVTIEPARKLRLIILDACRDNPFAKTMKRVLGTRAVTRGFAKVEPASPNTLVAFAAKAGSTAADGDGRNSPFTAALVRHIATPGLDLRKAFGFVRDEVMQQTSNRQEPFVYGSLGGNDVALVPAPAVAAPASPAATVLADVRRDYELAERVGTREAWELFIATYPSGFYAELAKAQRNKLAAEAARREAADKARRAGDDRERLAAEQRQREEEVKIAAAEKAKDEAQAKAAEQERAAANQGGPRLAGLTAAPEAAPKESISRQLQTELRRVGCHTTAIGDEWGPAARRSLAQFNKRARTKLDLKAASIDSLEAVKNKTARVCPLTCSHGFRAEGEACVAIVCKAGFEVGDGNTCERVRPKREAKSKRERASPPADAAPGRAAAAPSGQIFCTTSGCRPVAKGCRLVRADGRGLVGLASGGMAEECN
ncbi:MAG: caspase family protein [Pseudomonadota bacterium]